MSKHESCYEVEIVLAFLEAQGVRQDSGRFIRLNERRVGDSHRDMLERWAERETVEMSKVDPFLMQYDLMLFELEDWARVNYGRDGFVDPSAEPKELVG